jgi:hypothetical protein
MSDIFWLLMMGYVDYIKLKFNHAHFTKSGYYFSDILCYLFPQKQKTQSYQRNYADYLLRGGSFFPFLVT